MVIPVLVVSLVAAMLAAIVYMLVTPDSAEAAVEREVARIRRRLARGWSVSRILEHHPNFCECQIEYLRDRSRRMV